MACQPPRSEMEAQLRRVGTRRNAVRPAERRQEVEKRRLVRQVDDREAQAPLVPVTMKKVVIAHASVKQVAWHHACRIAVQVKRRARNVDSCGADFGLTRTRSRCQRIRERGNQVSAKESDGRLLVRIKKPQGGRKIGQVWVASHKPAVIAPVKTNPRQGVPWLVLQVRRLIECLVVVDAEHLTASHRSAQSPNLRREISGPDVSENEIGRASCRERV